MSCKIRAASPADKNTVLGILDSTNVFNPLELSVASDVFDEALRQRDSAYLSFILESDGRIIGWICFGLIPCTCGAFDIYWLAVDPAKQKQGIGKTLIFFAEDYIKKQNGRIIIVETSGSERYATTRRFYQNLKYLPLACLADFYAPGDGKIIFAKSL